jgi:hypothetical protein
VGTCSFGQLFVSALIDILNTKKRKQNAVVISTRRAVSHPIVISDCHLQGRSRFRNALPYARDLEQRYLSYSFIRNDRERVGCSTYLFDQVTKEDNRNKTSCITRGARISPKAQDRDSRIKNMIRYPYSNGWRKKITSRRSDS